MAGSAADLSGMLTGIANTVGSMGQTGVDMMNNLSNITAPRVDPNDPKSLMAYADWLHKMGRQKEAQTYMQQARAQEAAQLARGREQREAGRYMQEEQARAISQTYHSLDPADKSQFITTMQEAGQGDLIARIVQQEEAQNRAKEAHEWAALDAQTRQALETKRQAAENVTKGWFAAQQAGGDELKKFIEKANKAGHGDVVQQLQARDLQYSQMLQSVEKQRAAGKELGREFFSSDKEYQMYKQQHATAPLVANDRAIAEHRIRYQAETASEMRGESRLTKWEDETIDEHLEAMDNTFSRWWPESLGGRPVRGSDSDRMTEVAIEAKRIYREEGRLITKDEYLELLKEASEAHTEDRKPFQVPETDEDGWGIGG